MKGLILQDMYVIKRHGRYFLFLVLMFSVLSVVSDSSVGFFIFYPILFVCLLASNLLAYDEQSHWNQTCDTLPVSRSDYVTSKYLSGLILSICVVVLEIVVLFARMIVKHTGSPLEVFSTASVMFCVALAFPAITQPFLFRFGHTNGKLLYGVVVALFTIGFVAIVPKFGATDIISGLLPAYLTFLPLVAGIVLYVVSWLISTRLYASRVL